jgi:hypothetical protein
MVTHIFTISESNRSSCNQLKSGGRMNAREIVAARKGKWCGSYGVTACPVCQPEMRNEQMSLSVSDKGGRLLMKCHKSNCGYVDILRGLGVSGNKPVEVSEDEKNARAADDVRRALSGRMMANRILKNTKRGFHPYAARKGFPNVEFPTITVKKLKSLMKLPKILEGLALDEVLLCVPMRTEDDQLQSIEFIASDGLKCFMPGGKLKKAACWMGKQGPVVVCEGVATGLSLWRCAASLGLSIRVAAAGSATNMISLRGVADYVMADNDPSKICEKTGKEVGKTGERAAREIGKPYAMPPIVGMDFNDYESVIPSEARLLLSRLLCDAPSLEVRQTK